MPFQVSLSKERFKFASSHFTIFSETEAEPLHGHNYNLSVDLDFSGINEKNGLCAEFGFLKNIIQEVCDELDEKVLLPIRSPYLRVEDTDPNYDVFFAAKRYSFPKEDCALIEVVNISSECLSQWLHQKLSKKLNVIGLESFSVTIEETAGQGVTYFKLAPEDL